MKPVEMSRRRLLATSIAGGAAALGGVGPAPSRRGTDSGQPSHSLAQVDSRALVSRSDLIYLSPVERPAEGLPIGNGRMGTLVWTQPNSLHFQINRNDVLAVNRNHGGKRDGAVDYCCGCAQVTIDLGGRPLQSGGSFRQRLAIYQAEARVEGEGVRARCFVSAHADVLALEIDDQRMTPEPWRIQVSMWRAPEVRTGLHVARYEFGETADAAVVVQKFREKDYRCASAVAVRLSGTPAAIEKTSDRARTIVVPAQKGRRLILIASAGSWDPDQNLGQETLDLIEKSSARTYEELRASHDGWWEEFWSRTFVHLTSEDGLADFMERVRTLHLYVMASTSRGKLPPKWNGSLFSTQGDARGWGSQFWVWTTEISYFPLHAADATDLIRPFFDMYVKQLPACREAARQRWGVPGGAYYLEAGPFDGPVALPQEAAVEYGDVYAGRKPNTQLSTRALSLGQFEAVLTQFADGRKPPQIAAGRYSYVSHIATSGCEVAIQAWWQYRHTGDKEWLRTHGYPLLRETLEFYRHLAKRETDGRYHLYGLNQHEGAFGTNDGLLDIAAIRGTAPLAIRAAEVLEVDAELRVQWREFLDHLVSYPRGSDPRTHSAVKNSEFDLWAGGYSGAVPHPRYQLPADEKLWPVFPFEAWTLETRQPETDKIVQALVELNQWRKSLIEAGTGPFDRSFRLPIFLSRTGRGRDLPAALASYYHGFKPLANGLSSFEPGPETQGTEILGCISTALQEGLLQSVSARPGEPEIVSVFPSWPKNWEASFRLLARGGFVVTASGRNGETMFVEIESRRGETCRLRNPWARQSCVLTELGGRSREVSGDVIQFETQATRRYRLQQKNRPKPVLKPISPKTATVPSSYSMKLPNGTEVSGKLGRSTDFSPRLMP